jgi:alpha-galactosidase
MEELCPNALLLNYTNPLVMLCGAINKLSKTRTVGLCHSVQGTAMHLAEYIGAPFEEVSYWVAGINHMAWFLRFDWKKKDAYPLLWKAMEKPEIYERDIVKWEIMRHFGAFVSESSIHNSEYMPYFRRTPEMIARYTSEAMWGVPKKGTTRAAELAKRRQQQEEEQRRDAYGDEPLAVKRSHEFCSYILNALETNVPYVFNGNVPNTGLITNLVQGSVVEVPIMTDACGLHPCYVGDLPPQLSTLPGARYGSRRPTRTASKPEATNGICASAPISARSRRPPARRSATTSGMRNWSVRCACRERHQPMPNSGQSVSPSPKRRKATHCTKRAARCSGIGSSG